MALSSDAPFAEAIMAGIAQAVSEYLAESFNNPEIRFVVMAVHNTDNRDCLVTHNMKAADHVEVLRYVLERCEAAEGPPTRMVPIINTTH